ncbi:MAG TPA: hypothetical protein VIN08_00135 [Ohtaekwangia sp.]
MARKKKESRKASAPKAQPSKQEETVLEETKTNDYRGLPQRDLKKNLGCG